MITFDNIIRYDALPWDEYVELLGYSHSYLKREKNSFTPEFKETDSVKLGKLVDMILTEPAKVDMSTELYQAAKDIAHNIKKEFGEVIDLFEKQVSFTADVSFQGHTISSKFRLDLHIPRVAVIDLKITKSKPKAIPTLIDYMGYKNQMFGYGRVAQAPDTYLMIYSIPVKQTLIYRIPVGDTNKFWENKVLKFGRMAA